MSRKAGGVASRGMVCAFVFVGGARCNTHEDHPVHHGKWFKEGWRLEPNHDFVPLERRKGTDRRVPA